MRRSPMPTRDALEQAPAHSWYSRRTAGTEDDRRDEHASHEGSTADVVPCTLSSYWLVITATGEHVAAGHADILVVQSGLDSAAEHGSCRRHTSVRHTGPRTPSFDTCSSRQRRSTAYRSLRLGSRLLFRGIH